MTCYHKLTRAKIEAGSSLTIMTDIEPPDLLGFSSTRIQRANRINNVEQSRLQGRLQLLEKEKIHKIRVTNQDIRLISLTLEYIQSSSGRSSEGRGPDVPIEKKKVDQGPCFLYGERILSRKVRRFQRPQSAFDHTTSHVDSETSSASSVPVRPQSSPTKRKPIISWAASSCNAETASTVSDDESEPESVRSAWEDDTSDVTKRILQIQEGKIEYKVALHDRQIGHLRGQREKGKAKVITLQESLEKDFALQLDSKKTSGLSKNAQLSEILNQRRPTLTASTWGRHLSKGGLTPMTYDIRSQNVRSEKLKLNNKRQLAIQKKLNIFRRKYPA
ncbi:hypothetical protein LOTGIDRAFT_161906 [Lottia gigantea]|uniref:Uncharacterized protein n=1 Tax=Lottia gigantea TaxID=225164 RepID=V4A9D5_LOTGI|nr:hypothetical protein LOTGIDRAFT_161906 [Lottia gigantea]ESO93342.1 hypothetical protein LOTGIDRAFT_161906 [Lottia gigantea]